MPKATLFKIIYDAFDTVAYFHLVVLEPVFFSADISNFEKADDQAALKFLWLSFQKRHSQVLSPMVVIISDFHPLRTS